MSQSLRSYWRNSLYDSVHYGLRFANPVSVKKEYNSEPFKRFRRRFSSLLSFLYGRVYDLELSFRQSGRDFKKLDSCHWNSYGSSSNLAGNAGSESLQKPGTAVCGSCAFVFYSCADYNEFFKGTWGRMRFREMTDPIAEFTRWYQIVPRGGFDNVYASFPSGHSMNSAGVILLTLLPPIIPALKDKEKALHIFVYIWCAVVGISRVFMGAHFASDVTVGILLSLTIFEVLRTLIFRKKQEV